MVSYDTLALPPAIMIHGDMWNSSHLAADWRPSAAIPDFSENAAGQIMRKDGVYGFPSTFAQITKVAS